jgi:hypothetical protein
MKTIITTLALASLVATSAVAKIVHTEPVDHSNVYQSESLGHQSYPNPDRDFSIENLSSHAS